MKRKFSLLAIMVIIIIFGVIFIFYVRPKSVGELQYVEVKTISSTPDSIIKYFSSVTSLWFDSIEKRLYVSDLQAGCIAIFDTNLNYLARIGKKGKGPDEFDWINFVGKFDNLLFVYVPRGIKSFELVDGSPRYLSLFSVPFFPSNTFAVSVEGNLIMPASSKDDSLLAVYDAKGNLLRLFGKKIPQETEQRTFLKNGVWPVVDGEGNIYVVFLSLPYIRKYSRDFNLLIERHLSDEVKYGLKIIAEKEKGNPNVRHTMVAGVFYRKPYLYIRYADQLPVINVYDEKTLELRKKIRIKNAERSLTNFVVISDKSLVFFDMKNGELVKCEVIQ